MFLDSDDWIAEGSVEALVNETFEGKADLVSAVLQTTNNNYLFTECQHGCEFHKLYDKNFIKNKLFNNDKVGVLGVHIGSLAEYLQDSFNRPGDRYISHATLVNVLYKRTII